MELENFRASKRYVPIEQAKAEYQHIADLDFGPDYTHAMLYENGFFMVHSRHGFYLLIEREEYESNDLKMLEFILWLWSQESSPEIDAMRAAIWG